jgi:hypothetical protein
MMFGDHLKGFAGQAIFFLGGLIGIRDRAQADPIFLPPRLRKFSVQNLGDVHLHLDLALKIESVLKAQVPMTVSGKAIRASVPTAAIEIERVMKRFGAVRQPRVMQGALHLDRDIFHFFGIVIDFGVSGRIGSGKKKVFHSGLLF